MVQVQKENPTEQGLKHVGLKQSEIALKQDNSNAVQKENPTEQGLKPWNTELTSKLD